MIEKQETNHYKKDIDYYKQKKLYIPIEEDNKLMQDAKQAAIIHSLTPTFPIGIILVKDGEIISTSANGNGYHEEHINSQGHKAGCRRRYLRKQLKEAGKPPLKDGEHHDLCLGCNTDFHAEARAIREATDKSKLKGADVYMYGHWWCCGDCWDKMEDVGIKDVYVVDEFRDKDKLKAWRKEFKQLKEGGE